MNHVRLPVLSLLLLLASCAEKSDPNAASAALFETVIKADKEGSEQVCDDVITQVQRLPAKYELSAQGDAFFQDYRTLEKHGYVTIKKVTTTDPYGGRQIGAWEVALTPKWKQDLGIAASGPRCYATWTAQTVEEFTPPKEVNGVQVSQATVTGNTTYEPWAAPADLRKVFGLLDVKETSKRTYTLALREEGWQVIGANP